MKSGTWTDADQNEPFLIISSGIALSRPEASVRVHQTQPLYVAGQCLTHNSERKLVVDLLRNIETDLGQCLQKVRPLSNED